MPIAIITRSNLEHLYLRIHMLYKHTLPTYTPIFILLGLRYCSAFRFPLRGFTVRMQLCYPLIPFVPQYVLITENCIAYTPFIKFVIMRTAFSKSGTEYPSRLLIDNQVSFYGMVFFLTRIPFTLFF